MLTIFSLPFWFDISPVRMGNTFTVGFFVLFALLCIGAAGARIAKRNAEIDKPMKHLLERSAGSAITGGVLGFIWLFLSFEEIAIFGARFWFLVWCVGMGIALWKIYVHATKEMPEERKRRNNKSEAAKYLPRRSR